ncbi:MAG TPA: hypothetical protein VEL11_10615 [Candidatus Bathyarchaeia archaeon]|nr:hypothetical protein [Candidatus Bathyarchaeia archaeon]
MNSIAGSEKTEVVYGTSNVLDTEIQFFYNVQEGRPIPAWNIRDHL